MKIGIFDSGSGGRFVATKLRGLLPQHSYLLASDSSSSLSLACLVMDLQIFQSTLNGALELFGTFYESLHRLLL